MRTKDFIKIWFRTFLRSIFKSISRVTRWMGDRLNGDRWPNGSWPASAGLAGCILLFARSIVILFCIFKKFSEYHWPVLLGYFNDAFVPPIFLNIFSLVYLTHMNVDTIHDIYVSRLYLAILGGNIYLAIVRRVGRQNTQNFTLFSSYTFRGHF